MEVVVKTRHGPDGRWGQNGTDKEFPNCRTCLYKMLFCHRLTATARKRPLLWREESESKSVCSCCKHLGGGTRHCCKYGDAPHTESHSTAPVYVAVSKAVSGRRAGVLHGQGTVLPTAKPLGGDNGLPMVAYGLLLVPFAFGRQTDPLHPGLQSRPRGYLTAGCRRQIPARQGSDTHRGGDLFAEHMGRAGVEPATRGFSVLQLYQLSYRPMCSFLTRCHLIAFRTIVYMPDPGDASDRNRVPRTRAKEEMKLLLASFAKRTLYPGPAGTASAGMNRMLTVAVCAFRAFSILRQTRKITEKKLRTCGEGAF